MSQNNQKKSSSNVNLILFALLNIIPIHRIPGALADIKKAIKNKKFLYPLLCPIYVVSMIVVPVSAVFNFVGDSQIIAFLFLVLSITCLVLSIKYMKPARAKLAFYCDDCLKPMEYNYTSSCAKTETVSTSKEVVTGSHYNVKTNKDGSFDVHKVVDTEKRYTGSYKRYTYTGCATLNCAACSKKREIPFKVLSLDPSSANSEEVKNSVIERIIENNRNADQQLLLSKIQD